LLTLPTLEPKPSKVILFVLGHVHKWENMKENVFFKSTCSWKLFMEFWIALAFQLLWKNENIPLILTTNNLKINKLKLRCSNAIINNKGVLHCLFTWPIYNINVCLFQCDYGPPFAFNIIKKLSTMQCAHCHAHMHGLIHHGCLRACYSCF